jgi:hypothetical protein
VWKGSAFPVSIAYFLGYASLAPLTGIALSLLDYLEKAEPFRTSLRRSREEFFFNPKKLKQYFPK